jgi:hypothetical protein
MQMQRTISVLMTALVLLVIEAHADSLDIIRREYRSRHQRLHNLCFTYKGKYTIVRDIDYSKIDLPNDNKIILPKQMDGEFMATLCRSQNGLVRFTSQSKTDPFREAIIKSAQKTSQGADIRVLPNMMDQELWYGEGWNGLIHRQIEYIASKGEVSDKDVMFNLFPCPTNGIYCEIRHPNNTEFRRFDIIILGNFDLFGAQDVKWQIENEDAQQWTLRGEYPDYAGLRGTIRITLLKPNTLLQSVEMVITDLRNKVVEYKRWEVKAWTDFNGLKIPQTIEIERRKTFSTVRYLMQLDQVKPLEKNFSLNLPIGLQVDDYRLLEHKDILNASNLYSEGGDSKIKEKLVIYGWTGRLYSPEELRQLAYQQGNLVPPDTPRRRYTPWLLLPAILFFLAAGYLYFRNRRGHSARPNR